MTEHDAGFTSTCGSTFGASGDGASIGGSSKRTARSTASKDNMRVLLPLSEAQRLLDERAGGKSIKSPSSGHRSRPTVGVVHDRLRKAVMEAEKQYEKEVVSEALHQFRVEHVRRRDEVIQYQNEQRKVRRVEQEARVDENKEVLQGALVGYLETVERRARSKMSHASDRRTARIGELQLISRSKRLDALARVLRGKQIIREGGQLTLAALLSSEHVPKTDPTLVGSKPKGKGTFGGLTAAQPPPIDYTRDHQASILRADAPEQGSGSFEADDSQAFNPDRSRMSRSQQQGGPVDPFYVSERLQSPTKLSARRRLLNSAPIIDPPKQQQQQQSASRPTTHQQQTHPGGRSAMGGRPATHHNNQRPATQKSAAARVKKVRDVNPRLQPKMIPTLPELDEEEANDDPFPEVSSFMVSHDETPDDPNRAAVRNAIKGDFVAGSPGTRGRRIQEIEGSRAAEAAKQRQALIKKVMGGARTKHCASYYNDNDKQVLVARKEKKAASPKAGGRGGGTPSTTKLQVEDGDVDLGASARLLLSPPASSSQNKRRGSANPRPNDVDDMATENLRRAQEHAQHWMSVYLNQVKYDAAVTRRRQKLEQSYAAAYQQAHGRQHGYDQNEGEQYWSPPEAGHGGAGPAGGDQHGQHSYHRDHQEQHQYHQQTTETDMVQQAQETFNAEVIQRFARNVISAREALSRQFDEMQREMQRSREAANVSRRAVSSATGRRMSQLSGNVAVEDQEDFDEHGEGANNGGSQQQQDDRPVVGSNQQRQEEVGAEDEDIHAHAATLDELAREEGVE